jgi:hypothetical protein
MKVFLNQPDIEKEAVPKPMQLNPDIGAVCPLFRYRIGEELGTVNPTHWFYSTFYVQ